MKNIFKVICKKCNRRCCSLNVMIVKNDRLKLKHRINPKLFRDYGQNILVHWGSCPFLNVNKGCTLSERLKPFDCKLFPLTFIYKRGKIEIFLNKKCPQATKISQKWIDETKKWLNKELKTWTKEEKEIYSEIIKKHSVSKLKLLK